MFAAPQAIGDAIASSPPTSRQQPPPVTPRHSGLSTVAAVGTLVSDPGQRQERFQMVGIGPCSKVSRASNSSAEERRAALATMLIRRSGPERR